MRSPTTRAIVGLLLLTGVATWGAKQTGFLTGSILESETMQFRAQSAYAVQQNGVLTIPSGTDVQLDWSRVNGQMFNGFESLEVTDCYLYASSDIDGLVTEKSGAPTVLDNIILNEQSYVRQYGVRTVRNITSSRAFTLKCYFQVWYSGQISLVSSQTIQVNVGSGIDTSTVQPYAHRSIVYPPALSPVSFTLTSGAAVSGSDNVLDIKPGSSVMLQWKIDPVQDVNPGCALEFSEPVSGAIISNADLLTLNNAGAGGVYWSVKKQGTMTIPSVSKSLMVNLVCSQPFDSQGYGSAYPFYVFRSVYVQPQAQCADGKDNDADGLTDFPADSDCASLTDNSENIPAVSSSSAMSLTVSSAGAQSCSKADAGYCGTQGCAGDLLSYNNHTYLRYDTAAISWQNARTHCQGIGGDLVSITSSGEQAAVYNGLVGTNRSDLWIGLSDIANEGSFKLVDGTTPSYTNFYPGNPDDGYSNEDCVEMNYADYAHDGRWNDFPCDNGYGLISGFICELPKACGASSASSAPMNCSASNPAYCGPKGCPAAFAQYQGHEYTRYDTAPGSWQDARSHCQATGGDLVTIGSAGEQAAIFTNFMGGNRHDVWIGLTDSAQEGTWKWIDGTTPSYTNWHPGEPDSSGPSNDQDCGQLSHLNFLKWDGKWSDGNCPNGEGLNTGFICEYSNQCGTASASSAPALTECNDGIDNDGDGTIDKTITNASNTVTYDTPEKIRDAINALGTSIVPTPLQSLEFGCGPYFSLSDWGFCNLMGSALVSFECSWNVCSPEFGSPVVPVNAFICNNTPGVCTGTKVVRSANCNQNYYDNGSSTMHASLVNVSCAAKTACSDGVDNDGDGLVDAPQDPGCASALDTSEIKGDPDCDSGTSEGAPVVKSQCNDGIDNDKDGATDALVERTDPNAGAERTFTHEEVRKALNALNSSLVPTDIPSDAAVSSTLATAIQFCEKVGMQIRSVAGVDKGYFSFFNQNYNTSAGKQYGWNGSAFVLNGDPHTQNLIWVKCASLSGIQCNDGVDNDTDGSKDFPADIGCATVNDDSEVPHDLDCDSPDDIMEAGPKGNSANVVDPSRPGFGGMSFDGNNLVLMPMQGGNSSEDGNVLLFGPVFMPAVCGNGVASSNEQCDDGNTADNDGCSSKCIWEPYGAGAGFCGDGQCVLPEVRTSLMQSAYVPGSTWVLCPQDCDTAPAAAAGGSSAHSSSSAFSFTFSEPSSSASSSSAESSEYASSAFSFAFSSSSVPGGCVPGTICSNNAACGASGICPGTCFPGTLCPTGDICPENGLCPSICTPGTRCPNGEICAQTGICPATFSSSSAPTLAPAAGDECIPGTFCSDGQICLENGFCPEPLPASSSSAPATDTSTCAGNLDCPSNLCINGYCGCTNSAQCGGNACIGGFCTNIPAGMLAFDACASDAQCPAGMFCQGGDCVAQTSRCGDGRVDAGEACDDGNAIDTDGCTIQCLLGVDSACSSPLQCQSLICTDGICGLCTSDMQCPDDMICSGGWCVGGSRSGVLADGVMIPSELAALLATGTGFGLYQDGTTYEEYQAMLLQRGAPHAPVGNTGPESVAIMAAGASAGYTWMKLRRKRKS